MKLSEIINMEYQLHMDSHSDPAEVRERDRKIGMTYLGLPEDRTALFRYWLKELEKTNTHPGESVSSGLTFLRYMIFFFFLISGAGTCSGILSYNGSQPVNVINFLAVFTGFQLLLYLLFFMNILPGPVRSRIPLLGDFYRFAGFLINRGIRIAGSKINKTREKTARRMTDIFYQARSRHIIYTKIERWTLFSITQLGGLAFSLGALITCMYLVTFSDIAFAWNTTLDISSGTFHWIISVISLPWSFIAPDQVPSIELIESTRFFRLDGNYSGAGSNALLAGGWWRFLIYSLLFYGVIPRIILLTASRFALHRALVKAPFLSAELDSLNRRLTAPLISIKSDRVQSGRIKPVESDPAGIREPLKADSCSIILWGDIELSDTEIRDIVKSGLKWDIIETYYAGMLDNEKDDQTLSRFDKSEEDEPVLILTESWEAPGKAIAHFLERLRMKLKQDRMIVVGLINMDRDKKPIPPSGADWQNWHDAVLRLGDPFICIEPVTGVLQ